MGHDTPQFGCWVWVFALVLEEAAQICVLEFLHGNETSMK